MQDLIDWAGVARNALWILGLSIALAALSDAGWWATTRAGRAARGASWRQAFGRPGFRVAVAAGMTLFAASLAWSATRWWERSLWVLLGVLFTWQAFLSWRMSKGGGA